MFRMGDLPVKTGLIERVCYTLTGNIALKRCVIREAPVDTALSAVLRDDMEWPRDTTFPFSSLSQRMVSSLPLSSGAKVRIFTVSKLP